MTTAVVVASGDLASGDEEQIHAADIVVAADGGALGAERSGRLPDVVVGDLDSLDGESVERLAARGVAIQRHPADKEASDAELAIERARHLGAERIVLLGATGGERLDHELANVLLLADPRYAAFDLVLVAGPVTAHALHGGERLELEAAIGDLVTLLPVGGDATGVRTAGLRWALDGATLVLGRSRGLSNEVVMAPASVELASGTLLVVTTKGGSSS
jgi:thiamine pyrophosphokinase